jgi:serine/threonine-protein kinase
VSSQGLAGLLQVEATPGAVPKRFTVLNTASGEVSHAWPDVLPNGKGVLFTVIFNGRNGVKGSISLAIAVAKIPSGKHRVIVNDAVYARYSTSGHLLFVTTDGTLMTVPFDQNSMKSTGEPTALIEGIHVGEGGTADLAISATGTLVYGTGAEEAKQELVWVTRNGKAQSVDPDWTGYFWCPALSADGKRLAVARSVDLGHSVDVWVKQLNRGPSINLTLEASGQLPTWTPDGRSVTFTIGDSPSASSLWTKRADGGAQAVLQFREKRGAYAARWSPDGKWLIFETDLNAPGLGDILGIRPGTDTVAVPLVATSFTETSPAISPDGRWLAYSSNESGHYEIYVVPFPNTGSQRWVVSTRGGTEPLWSHRGSELFYRDGAGYLVAVEVKTNPTLSLGRSTPLFPAAGFDSLLWAARYAVAPDDRRFLMIRPVAASAPDKLIVVDNWFEELKSRK